MSWSKQEVLAFLDERPRVGRLATVTSGGEPRVVPVWFRTRDDKVLVHTRSGIAKARNIEIAWRLLRWWPRIREQVAIMTPPAAFELPFAYRTGRLKVLRG